MAAVQQLVNKQKVPSSLHPAKEHHGCKAKRHTEVKYSQTQTRFILTGVTYLILAIITTITKVSNVMKKPVYIEISH